MKQYTKDENICCTNYTILNEEEIFKKVTPNIIDGVYDHYYVSDHGRVYSFYFGKFLKPDITNAGYYRVSLATKYGYKHVLVHRLVLMAFDPIPNMEDFEVNHINSDKLRNNLWNLEWSTSSENKIHGINNGLYDTTISAEKVIEICELLQMNKFTNVEIANMTGVKDYIVSQIKTGESWAHISCNYNIINRRVSNKFSDDELHNLCKYFELYPRDDLTITEHCTNALIYCGYSTDIKYINSTKDLYMHRSYTKISSQYNF